MVQHSLHEVAHLLICEDHRRQLRHPVLRDEHFGGGIDPQFFHLRVINEGLEGSKSRDLCAGKAAD